MVVAKVLSDSKDLYYTVETRGATEREGGTGIKWRCNCPHNAYRGKICKHILRVKAKMRGEVVIGVELWNQ